MIRRRTRRRGTCEPLPYSIRSKIATYRRRNFPGMFFTDMPTWKQTGGSKVQINGRKFDYYDSVNGDTLILKNKEGCFTVHIRTSPDGQIYAHLQEVVRTNDCKLSADIHGPTLVRAGIQIARDHGAKWIELSDESTICKTESHSVSLSDYYMVTRGKSWYETIAPFRPKDTEYIEALREVATTISWKELLCELRRKKHFIIQPLLRAITPPSNPSAPGSAMETLRSIPYSIRCEVYIPILPEILMSYGYRSLRTTSWYLPLSDDFDDAVYRASHAKSFHTLYTVEKEE